MTRFYPVLNRPTLPDCAAPRFFVETGQVQRRIISWELARVVRDNLTMRRALSFSGLESIGQ
jgi:hypothetical protein